METEIEAQFPNIDPDSLRAKLQDLGAVQEHEERLMRRANFDFPDFRLKHQKGWVRVRDEGDKVTLSYKQMENRGLHGTKEITVVVDSYETTCEFLKTIGMITKASQETKRERWLYKNVEVTIGTWPWIPTFVELEGPTENLVRAVASELNLDWSHAMHGSVENMYQMHYNFTEDEINLWEIYFIPEPNWLLAKKR